MSDSVPGIASFHLVTLKPGRVGLAMLRLGTDRLLLRRTPGLKFWRLLGTGAGRDTGPGADLRRTALFAVWDDEASLDAFHARMEPRWSRAAEAYHLRLRGLRGHGTWRGFDVLGATTVPASAKRPDDAKTPVAVVTRADVRLRRWKPFAAAGPSVSRALQQAPGLLAVCGIGEAPVGRQATFSLWRDAESARSFAYSSPEHVEVIRRTRVEGWYGEEMFAVFSPYDSRGTWDGSDPLAR